GGVGGDAADRDRVPLKVAYRSDRGVDRHERVERPRDHSGYGDYGQVLRGGEEELLFVGDGEVAVAGGDELQRGGRVGGSTDGDSEAGSRESAGLERVVETDVVGVRRPIEGQAHRAARGSGCGSASDQDGARENCDQGKS